MSNTLINGFYDFKSIEELNKGKTEDIPIKLIKENEKNKIYDPRPLDDYKDMLLKEGLLQPLVAYKKGENYILVCGHHRYKAICALLKEGKHVHYYGKAIVDKVPVLVHEEFVSEDEEWLVLLHTNYGRKLSDEETRRISEKIVDIDANMYPTKEDQPKGITTRERLEMISPISAKTIERSLAGKNKKSEFEMLKKSLCNFQKQVEKTNFSSMSKFEYKTLVDMSNKVSKMLKEKSGTVSQ